MKEIFARLKTWADLPNYQLERRVDIFFTFYLAAILNSHFKKESKDHATILPDSIIPEFPLKNQETKDKKTRNRSIKVDYLAWNDNSVFLVEFKTYQPSYDKEQIEEMRRRAKSWDRMVRDIETLKAHSYQEARYASLQKALPSFKGTTPKVNFVCILPRVPAQDAMATGCAYIGFQEIEHVLAKQEKTDALALELKDLFSKIHAAK